MGRKKAIPKSREQRLSECETHLYFLWDAYRLYPEQPERYKQIATELRVLVGDHKPAQRLLLAMMQEYGFTYDVQPPGPPFHNQPIPFVGWQRDPHHQAMVSELQTCLGNEEALTALIEKQAKQRKAIPFPEYVERGLAVYIAPYDYSFRELVAAIAQQEGSSHESSTVDEPIQKMKAVQIGRDSGHIAPLIRFAELVLEVGTQFLLHVIQSHGYSPQYFQVAESLQPSTGDSPNKLDGSA